MSARFCRQPCFFDGALLATHQPHAQQLEGFLLEQGGPGDDREGLGPRQLGRDGVPADGGEIPEQGAEAVHRVAVGGLAGPCLDQPSSRRNVTRLLPTPSTSRCDC